MNPYTMNTPFCSPNYKPTGQVNCTPQCIPGYTQYSLCPYNPYLSNSGEGCVTTTCGTQTDKDKQCCQVACCNSVNIDCVDGCYTTKVNIDWIAPLVFYTGLTANVVPQDIELVLHFQTINTDPAVLNNTCDPDCCPGTVTTTASRSCCCPSKPQGCCCYPTPSSSDDVDIIRFTSTESVPSLCGSLSPSDVPDTISIVTPLDSCCPNPCSDKIQVQVIAELNKSLIGVSPITNLSTTDKEVDINLTIGSFIAPETTEGILTLYYTYTCVCNQPTWTIYNAKLIFQTPVT